MKLYSIRDQVAEKFGPVFLATNDGVAIRQFTNVLKDVDYVGEYDLYALASFDENTGNLICIESHNAKTGNHDGLGTFNPEHVCNGLNVKPFRDVEQEDPDA